MLLNIDKLNFAYGVNDIFIDTNFKVNDKEKIGLIGKNGIGKSTFIKLLTGELEIDSGKIEINPYAKIGYLEQISTLDKEKTVYELYLDEFKDVIKKENRLRELEDLFEHASEDELNEYLEEYGMLHEFFEDTEKLSYESKIKGMIIGLGFTLDDLNKQYKDFSGGEKTKLNLGILLLRNPDLLLLDEPTNFLDIKALTWLENFLKNYNGSFILSSHDRYFLDRVCNRIDEIEDNQIKSYYGNYTNYFNKKKKLIAEQNAHYKKALKEYERQSKILQRYKDFNSIQSNKHAKSREKMIERMEIPQNFTQDRTVKINFQTAERSGDDVLNVEDLSKSYGERTLFENINFEVKRGDRIGIIGENGIGKTTLFNILRRKLSKDTGIITFGSKVKIGWFDQETRDLDEFEELDLIEIIREDDPLLDDGEIRNYLANFLFTKEDVFKQVKDLSGGEKARIKFAKLMLKDTNFLILDEPTNHIDMPTKELLEEALIDYDGTLLCISHDRYFLNKISNKIFEFTKDGIKVYLGNYDSYLKQKEDQQALKAIKQEEVIGETKTSQKKKRAKIKEIKNYIIEIRREIRKLEQEIEDVQTKIEEYETLMIEPEFYSREDSEEIVKAYPVLKDQLNDLMNNWEEQSILLEEKELEVKQM